MRRTRRGGRREEGTGNGGESAGVFTRGSRTHNEQERAIQDANPILRAGRLLPPLLAQRA